MQLSDVQKTLYNYFKGNSYTNLLMHYSSILALIYPIYLILTRISFMHFITGIFGVISIIFYFAYFIGLIMSFAKNDMLAVTVAFGLKAILEVIDLFIYTINVNSILSLIVYVALALCTYNYYNKSNSNS